ncbi:MAG: sulfoxide reductase heme-binding subunit YedZ, partial [Gammaproteobacteria bacterium]|nr:sulfoxide reductase heme-binding subunit YedZ [Gammaproteobacteria bacterium]MBU0889574.1 sulfoxide reductase heme-binding subunit YedZ [Gammaproteobacteria bacterium]
WQALHRTVYAVAALAILHFFWMRAGKNDFGEVAVYAAILAALMGWRVWNGLRKRRAARAGASSAAVPRPATRTH